jgi:hypothetical protein
MNGSVVDVCGFSIGRVVESGGSGPFYTDASLHSRTLPITAAARTEVIYVRVSFDCSHGAAVSVSDGHVLHAVAAVRATDQRDEVVSVLPIAPGQATLSIRGPGSSTRSVSFMVSASRT